MTDHEAGLRELQRQSKGLTDAATGACRAVSMAASYRGARESLQDLRDAVDRVLEAGTEAVVEARTHLAARQRAANERRSL